MTIPARLLAPVLCASVVLMSAGCADQGEKAEQKATDAAACSSLDPRDMTQSDYACALGAEFDAIARALATVEDRASADRAVPILHRAKARIAAVVKERDRLNNERGGGAKAAMASAKMPKLAAANRALLKEMTRIARQHPELMAAIGPALEGIDIN